MKKTCILLCLISLLSVTIKSQIVYTQGNLTATLTGAAVHDSSICQSTFAMVLTLTKQNSFAGDSIMIKFQYGGEVIFDTGNATGQTPWTVFDTLPGGLVYDNNISNGIARLDEAIFKAISGTDTIYNIADTFSLPVSNPCQYSTVSGMVFADYNGNCTYGSGDVPLNGIQVETLQPYTYGIPGAPFEGGGASTTSGGGNYNISVQISYSPYYDVFLPGNYSFVFANEACSPVWVDSLTQLPGTVNFALQCTGGLDAQVFAHTTPAVRPLVPFPFFAGAVNTGCPGDSGYLKVILDPRVTYTSAYSHAPTISGDTLIWHFDNLTSLSTNGYWNDFFSVVSLTPGNQVSIGDSLCFTAFINVQANDVDPANNTTYFCVPVVSSFDPNLKTVNPAGSGLQGLIPSNDDSLTYTIHFQNTGNAAAYNVTVIDTLDPAIIPGSLKITGSSANLTPAWYGPNIVAFAFNGINLPDSGSDPAGSNAAFSFNVHLQPALSQGTQIKNNAWVYFDSNSPIQTNTTLNTIGAPALVQQINPAGQMEVFPNPAASDVTVSFSGDVTNYTLRLMDLNGQTIAMRNSSTGTACTFDIAALSAGVYFIELNSGGKLQMAKLVKE